MKIKKLKVQNFMGYKGTCEFELPQIAALVGHNGMGKTSILNGIRYALTGIEPDGSIIHNEAQEASVEIVMENPMDGTDITFKRTKDRTKPSKFLVDGVKTTNAKLNEKISDVCGISIDKIKILSSAEVVANMKPQEFSKFILDYIPEKIDIRFIIDNLDRSNPQILDTIDANLPEENISLEDIDEFLDTLKSARKELKARLTERKALYATKPAEMPYDRDEIVKRLGSLSDFAGKKEAYEAKKKAYENALENKKKQDAMLTQLTDELSKLSSVTRPDFARRDQLIKERKENEDMLRNKDIAINGANSALTQLELTLDSLNKPICPLSPLITCHEDKTVAKEDISDAIEASKEGIKALREDSEKLNERLKEIASELELYESNAKAYEKKCTIAKTIKSVEDNKIVVPDAPDEEGAPASIEAEMNELKAMLKTCDEYLEGIRLKSEIMAISDELDTDEYLVRALSDKGCVRVAIIKKYTSVFENLLNERSGKIRSDVSFSVVPDDGMRVLMDNGNGMLPYESCSGGEKAYMLFMIMDMLNSLSGTKILFIDELSVMDADNFNSLLDVIKQYSSEYDHVLFAAVDHKETVSSVKKHKIPILKIEREPKTAA